MRWPPQEANGSTPAHRSGRTNVGGAARDAFVLGKVRKWDDHVHLHNSVHNRKHPELFAMLRSLMRLHNPSFRFNAVQLNRNVQTQPHHDRGNRGSSYCLALGTLLSFSLLPGTGFIAALAATALAGGATALLAKRQIGGYTGDVLGGSEQVVECFILIALTMLPAGAAGFGWPG